MKAAIVNPYLDTLGGGERYTMAFAKALMEQDYKVFVQWKDSDIRRKLEERFGIDLEGIDFIKDVKRGDNFDLCFWVSDGSIPLLRARKNILHFQVPFKGVGGTSLMNRMKLYRVEDVICNSYYTKQFIDEEYGVDSKVIYPPVDINKFKPKRKENIILFVGRFSELKQLKRQDVLIKVFKKMVDNGLENWKLVLAGGVEIGAKKYLNKLKSKTEGYKIEFVESPKFTVLKDLFGKAKIFWSAAGYGVDEDEDPGKMEHFGITIVEAMSTKTLPVVFEGGGHKEIVADGKNGFLWKKRRVLEMKTQNLIDDQKTLRKIANQARDDAGIYEYERFIEEVGAIL